LETNSLGRQLAGKILSDSKGIPNRLERLFDKLTPTFIKYTGDGTFFIRFKDGKVKNPDFVVRPFRKWKAVIEIFGEYYHRPEEEKELIERYKEVGVNCLVVWEREIGQEDKRRKALIKKINDFLDRISSETIRQTPSKNEGDDIVQPTL
jgi:G:T-mismatch repair DNA endonuclease (very short patch repair protein)